MVFCQIPLPTLAQTGGAASAYSYIGLTPRTIAIGNAYVAGGEEGIYAFYNPAISSEITYNQIDLSGAAMSFDRRLASLNSTFPLPPNAGLSISLQYAGAIGFDGRSMSGYHTEFFSSHEITGIASFGLRVTEYVSVGTNLKLQTARYNSEVSAPIAFGIDLGMLIRFNEQIQVGIAMQNLLSNFVWDTQELYGTMGSNQKTDKIPTRFKIGATYIVPSYHLRFYSEFENRNTKATVMRRVPTREGGPEFSILRPESATFYSNYLRFGAAHDIHERIVIRTGWQSGDLEYLRESQQFSGGFTLKLPYDLYQPEIDYAILREPNGVSWMHMFSIRLNINK